MRSEGKVRIMKSTSVPEQVPAWAPYILAVICTLSLLLRVHGIGHGYPDFVTGDEKNVLITAVGYVYSEDLEPSHYHYPALYSYLFGLSLVVASFTSLIPDVGSLALSVRFTQLFAPAQLAILGRSISAFAGCGLVALTYLVGRRSYGWRVGLAGAVFSATSTVLVSQSRYALPDVPMALASLGACYYAFGILHHGRRSDYIAAGLLAGLAVSTKYNAAPVAMALAVAHWLRVRKSAPGERRYATAEFWSGAAAGLVGFLAGSPYWLITAGKYYQGLAAVLSNTQFSLRSTEWPLLEAVGGICQAEMAWGLLFLIGIGYAIYRRRDSDWVLLSVIVPGFLYIGSWQKSGLHYFVHLLPMAGLLGARALGDTRLVLNSGRGLALLLVITLPQVWVSIADGSELSRPRLTTVAGEWIEGNIPDGSTIGIYARDYAPYLSGQDDREFLENLVAENRYLGRAEMASRLSSMMARTRTYRQYALEYELPEPVVPAEYTLTADLEDPKTRQIFSRRLVSHGELRELGVDYLVLPSSGYSRFLTLEEPAAGTAAHFHFVQNRDLIRQFLDQRDPRFTLVREFVDDRGGQRTAIRIVKVN